MKYITHKLTIDEETLSPHYEITLSISCETVQEMVILMGKDQAARHLGIDLLTIMEELGQRKATNEIRSVSGPEFKAEFMARVDARNKANTSD